MTGLRRHWLRLIAVVAIGVGCSVPAAAVPMPVPGAVTASVHHLTSAAEPVAALARTGRATLAATSSHQAPGHQWALPAWVAALTLLAFGAVVRRSAPVALFRTVAARSARAPPHDPSSH